MGDLEPQNDIGSDENNTALEKDRKLIPAHKPKIIHFGHAYDRMLKHM